MLTSAQDGLAGESRVRRKGGQPVAQQVLNLVLETSFMELLQEAV